MGKKHNGYFLINPLSTVSTLSSVFLFQKTSKDDFFFLLYLVVLSPRGIKLRTVVSLENVFFF